ncbi:hypothetical protein G0U57_014173 [Chelydra serpentina]|uniref:Uncharacterized protein n=1 Tax=Chelydra serpentina TaxID=8475 RepID=A0A8T1SAF2_CHESE|nr:hypothetical protein G0U57_014173 [Chelydra serpentina]
MAVGSKFIEIWKKHFTLISASLYSLILVVLEKIMESEFICPEEPKWRHWYSVFYFVMPALTLLILGIIFHPSSTEKPFYYSDNKCKWSFCCPALLWIVILLLDGRYFHCLVKPVKENITGENPYQSFPTYQISQVRFTCFAR